MTDNFDLQRFVDAQDPVFDEVCRELSGGRKQGHWMWFIFPQRKELGQSAMAKKYGIASREEAESYLGHPILGPRLIRCSELVNAINHSSIDSILGYPDNLKFHSSMTLFSLTEPENVVFKEALRKYFNGKADQQTIELL